MSETQNPNSDYFKINEKALRADTVDVNKDKVQSELRQDPDITEQDIADFIDNLQKVADTINQKVKDRKLSTNNMYVTDDWLVKEYVQYAEKEVETNVANMWTETNVANMWTEINDTIASLINKIQVWNNTHIEVSKYEGKI